MKNVWWIIEFCLILYQPKRKESMAVTLYIPAIAAAVIKNKRRGSGDSQAGAQHPINTCTKEQSLEWLNSGKCQCCGAESGECKGICDECRLT